MRQNRLNLPSGSFVPFVTLCIAIAANGWNAPVLGGLRFNDLFLLASLALTVAFCRFSKLLLITAALLIASLLIPLVFGLTSALEAKTAHLGFIYKYSAIISVPLIACAVLTSPTRIEVTERLLFYSFLALSSWVYVYAIQVDSGSLYGVSRVSFPGSTDFLVSDAHLYSNYLGMSLMFYVLFYRRRHRHSTLLALAVSTLAVGALVLTGSRNGIMVVSLGIVLWAALTCFFGSISLSAKSLLLGFLSFFCVAIAIFYFWTDVYGLLSEAANRALNFNLQTDISSLRRLEKFGIAVDDWLGSSILFGAGVLYATLTWYDTGAGILLAHTGLLGVSVVLFMSGYFIAFCCARLRSAGIRTSLVLFILYLFSNLITEFALVTRSMLPSVLYICIPILVEKFNDPKIRLAE